MIIRLITLVFLFMQLVSNCYSQEPVVPRKNLYDKKWVHDNSYKMTWTVIRDTSRINIGTVQTNVVIKKEKILVFTMIELKGSASTWIDTTIVDRTDLSPLYHSSFNSQRDMVMNFGKTIKGYYRDNKTGNNIQILEKLEPTYFDSNFYPILLGWLPLKNTLRADISIFDYNPNGKTGLLKARVLDVSEGIYPSKKTGKKAVWIVEVLDDISGSKCRYHFDKITRQIYKQEITSGKAKMEMTLLE